MNKPTVIVTRTSSPYYVGGKGGSARGDMDTEPLLRRLVEERDDLNVVWYGVMRGQPDFMDASDVFAVNIDGVTAATPSWELMSRWGPQVSELQQRNPVCVIELFGQPPSWSWPETPEGARPHDWCVRYCAAPLWMMQQLELPRYGIVTDPKCYRRDMEMSSMGWEWCQPRAVLSQEERKFPRGIGSQQYTVWAKYSGCEFWLTRGMERQKHEKGWENSICANGHFGENRVKPRDLITGKTTETRDALWSRILAGLPHESTYLCGADWDRFDAWPEGWSAQDNWAGVYPDFNDVLKFIGQGEQGVMIPQWPGFNSTKPRLYALQGTVPRFFGRGEEPMTYDRDERILRLDHPARWAPGEADAHNLDRETIEQVLWNTRPDYTVLDRLIDETITSGCRWPEKDWLGKYGGYQPCGSR